MVSTSKKRDALVLLSGGIDSTACAEFYLSKRYSVSSLYLDYGQVAAAKEASAAKAISSHYNIPLKIVSCKGLGPWTKGPILGRNAFFLQTALMCFRGESGIIAIGIHSGTAYRDCTDGFVKAMQSTFDLYADGLISIGAPFIRWMKKDIWEYSKKKNVPVHLTYSCELGRKQPCGECLSCKDLEILYAG
jgi:7-cyano-7-deazaguanine synthase